ncbi:glycosyltransferase family 2 protein [Thermogemmatispora onikobensis]|uniref:glycosyltransferase family 2 protein n=1 Tax=Thermogemmatispora onikobensis TaxID=732234 RepID=UPI000A02F70E|nr:glycosyltransferase family A protein [Thermogemmatispora onikobensis]
MALVEVLIPTCGRKTGLAVVLAGLLAQDFVDFDVIISDQTEAGEDYLESVEIQTLVRALRWRGHRVTLHRHLPRRGLAEQRHFLLEQSRAPYVHYLDDDVLLEPMVLGRMLAVLRAEGCGFVGCAAAGLHFLEDVRPHQQQIELWEGPVLPEPFTPETVPWERHLVNNAANVLHLEARLLSREAWRSADPSHCLRYKVAWVGGANVLYDRAKLLAVGGFSWWWRLPPEHAGEEVLAQWLLLCRYGGCALLPCGTYHLGLPTTVPDRRCNATHLFAELARQYLAPYDWSAAPASDEESNKEGPQHRRGGHESKGRPSPSGRRDRA